MDLNIVQKSLEERRAKLRMNCDYPARMKGHDAQGNNFSEQVRVMNISTSGMFLICARAYPLDQEISLKIALPTGSLEWGSTDLTSSGRVVRCDQQSDGNYGIALKLNRYKF